MARFDDDVVVVVSVRQQSNHLIVHYHSYPDVAVVAVPVAVVVVHCARQTEALLIHFLNLPCQRHHPLVGS